MRGLSGGGEGCGPALTICGVRDVRATLGVACTWPPSDPSRLDRASSEPSHQLCVRPAPSWHRVPRPPSPASPLSPPGRPPSPARRHAHHAAAREGGQQAEGQGGGCPPRVVALQRTARPAARPVGSLLMCRGQTQRCKAAAGPSWLWQGGRHPGRRLRTCCPSPAAPCVPQVPSHVQKFAGQHWRPEQLQARLSNWLQNYKVQVGAGRHWRGQGCVWAEGLHQ